MLLLIQVRKLPTLAYAVGSVAEVQPDGPHDTTPTWVPDCVNGPPESPLHALLAELCAHTILAVTVCEPHKLLQVARATMFKLACNRADDVDPPDDVLPQPDTITAAPDAGSEPEAARVTVAALVPGVKAVAKTKMEMS